MEFYWVKGSSKAVCSMKTYLCKSESNYYIITTIDNKAYVCTCPDCINRNRDCKHIKELCKPGLTLLPEITLKSAVDAMASDETLREAHGPEEGQSNGDDTIEVSLTDAGKEFVQSLESNEPPPKRVMPEDQFDVNDIESLRKTMLAMYNNERTEDQAFLKLQGFLKVESIPQANKETIKDWMKLVMSSWEDLLEEIADVESD